MNLKQLLKLLGCLPLGFADDDAGGGGDAATTTESAPETDATEFPENQSDVPTDESPEDAPEDTIEGDPPGEEDDYNFDGDGEPDQTAADGSGDATGESGDEVDDSVTQAAGVQADGWSTAMLAKAQAAGLDPARVQQLDPNQLSEILLDHFVQNRGQHPAQGMDQQQGGQRAVPQQAPLQGLPEDQNFNIDSEVYDENFVKMESVVKGNHGRLAQLEQQIGMVGQFMQSAQNQNAVAAQQRFFQSADEYFIAQEGQRDAFGEGPAHGLGEQSPQLTNRRSVVDKAYMLASGYSQRGMQVPPPAELLREANHAVNGGTINDNQKAQARKDIAKDLKKRKKQSTSRPTQRRHAGEQRPEQSAVSYVKSFLAEHGED